MATRAIYTFANFEANNFKPKHFYVHWDGDPEGAAKYFESMLYFADLSEPSDPDLPSQFVYALEDIEDKSVYQESPLGINVIPQTNRLEAGDLEWGYTLTYINSRITYIMVHRIKNGVERYYWDGTLNQMLNDYLK